MSAVKTEKDNIEVNLKKEYPYFYKNFYKILEHSLAEFF